MKVYIAIPSLDGRIHVGTFMAIIQTVADLNAEGIDCNVESYVGDSLIASTRNILLAKFLATDCTDMLFLDSDISYEPGAVQRLLSHPVDFVAGLYRFKNDVEGYPMQCLPDPEGKGMWAHDPVTGEVSEEGLIEVAAVPTGFMRLTRNCVQKLFDAFPDRKYFPKDVPGLEARGLFEVPFLDGQLRGEDYTFCAHWRAIGGKVYFDPWIRLDHTGTKTFKGNVGFWLRNRGKEDSKEKLTPEIIEQWKALARKHDYKKLFDVAMGDA